MMRDIASPAFYLLVTVPMLHILGSLGPFFTKMRSFERKDDIYYLEFFYVMLKNYLLFTLVFEIIVRME